MAFARRNVKIRQGEGEGGHWRMDGAWKVVIGVGWVLFWLAGVAGERFPVGAMLVGPTLMLYGLVMIWRRRHMR